MLLNLNLKLTMMTIMMKMKRLIKTSIVVKHAKLTDEGAAVTPVPLRNISKWHIMLEKVCLQASN